MPPDLPIGHLTPLHCEHLRMKSPPLFYLLCVYTHTNDVKQSNAFVQPVPATEV